MLNEYYACRHGESMANVKGIVISDPAVGTKQYGLTEKGRRQAAATAGKAEGFGADTLIFSSDFKRAAETAEILRAALGVAEVQFDIRLRERFFGEYEGATHSSYSKAWMNDALNAEHTTGGVESAGAVRKRMFSVVQSLETEHAGRKIILVSHGDPLLLLQCEFDGIETAQHRMLKYFDTAELRALIPKGLPIASKKSVDEIFSGIRNVAKIRGDLTEPETDSWGEDLLP
ncbi:histidine phosphatase family protein [Pontiella sulfatireligans]|uniref:Glucosyl-3-phosphoglycerate phosphatase n=1 Tax=Pontiella sulfatireligans TaxID=2750658 RepID=A0A6C2UUF5_9BACT|nr:histidine phosphatase family protein [Pontiella sulfatireligans]VGO22804.1 Glucosyl-3-phosphoglycerate phosphatase [Pontiella sulfatireligans]